MPAPVSQLHHSKTIGDTETPALPGSSQLVARVTWGRDQNGIFGNEMVDPRKKTVQRPRNGHNFSKVTIM